MSKNRPKLEKSSGNVFSDLGFPRAEAENLKIRSGLMCEILRYIARHKLTQTEAARRMGVSQPRISEVKRGKIDLFTIDQLVTMLARVGVEVSFTARRRVA